jgi:putative protein kinase ArgK-like GTPase of G3E family
MCSARDGDGIDTLIEALRAHRKHAEASGGRAQRRARAREFHVIDHLSRCYGSFGLAAIGDEEELLQRIRAAADRSAYRLVEELGQEIEVALAGGTA